VQPIAVQVMICFANQEEKRWSLRKSGGSERKSGTPDFSARPAGLTRFCVYLWYTFPRFCATDKENSIPGGILNYCNTKELMSKDENVKTIRFPVKTDEKLVIIANKCGLSKLDLFVFMVDYFYKTKKDPRDLNDELLKNAINRKTDNIVAFIRTQEQELLMPLKKDSERMINSQSRIVDYFNQHIIAHNKDQKEAYAAQRKAIEEIVKYLQTMDRLQLEKRNLKARFKSILEHYVSQRENLNVFAKQADKDELVRFARAQLESL